MAFRKVRRDQIALTDAIDRYWDTYEWYRALKDGNVTYQ
jgi:hypothetical protein